MIAFEDLILSRAVVNMFAEPEVARLLAFRGGTALYKLHLRPAARYSEDIDLLPGEPWRGGEWASRGPNGTAG